MPLYFLMRLQHLQLPLRVETREEIKLVSVLKATGLIEAEIHPLQSHGSYAPPATATVICITDEGKTELEKWVYGRAPERHRAELNRFKSATAIVASP
jgi:adenine deaminase